MEMLTLILALSTIIWYIVDNAKGVWANLSWHKYITIGVVAILAAAVVFTFGLDIIVALALTADVTIVGEVLTVLAIMSGSSAVAEIIEKISSKKN